jgi:hypothetical protein
LHRSKHFCGSFRLVGDAVNVGEDNYDCQRAAFFEEEVFPSSRCVAIIWHSGSATVWTRSAFGVGGSAGVRRNWPRRRGEASSNQ